MRLKILICNDDGYDATGIRELSAALAEIADVFTFAPLTNHSGASSSLTLHSTIAVSESEKLGVVHGTPTDCIQIALHGKDVLPWKPDLTVSGINAGGNLGDDTIYSGTVAAAAESVLLGVPALAFSLACIPEDNFPPANFKAAATIARQLVEQLHPQLLANPQVMLNINIPDLPFEQIKAPQICTLGKRHPGRPLTEMHHNRIPNLRQFQFGINMDNTRNDVNSDFHAIENSHVAVTPLQFDLTDQSMLKEISSWFAQKK